MKSFIFGLLFGLIISAGIVWAEEQLSPLRNGTIQLNIDELVQYDEMIRLNHGMETIKLEPIELWRRATLSRKRIYSNKPKIETCFDNGEEFTDCHDIYPGEELK